MAVLPAQDAMAAPAITIMTQNMDEGTNYLALTTATDPTSFVAAVSQTYQEIAATSPGVRAGAIAQEIATQHPDLVALQEASIVRTGPLAAPVLPPPPSHRICCNRCLAAWVRWASTTRRW